MSDPGPLVPADSVDAFVSPPTLLVRGAASGPLAGTTLAVKDVIDVVGCVTGAGNPDLAALRSPATASAPVVEALVATGATVVGKTVTDELAYSLGGDNVHFPLPVNPAAPGRTTGGSSSGSAAAVAAGLVDLALGTDTGGSIRVPASYCGIVGWRPTHGAVSAVGVTPLSSGFDTVGAFARSLPLLRTAAEVMLSTTASTGRGRTPPTRVVMAAELVDQLELAVAEALFASVADTFGRVPQSVELGVEMDECLDAFRTLQSAEAWAAHGRWITEARPTFGPATEARFRAASEVTSAQITSASAVRDRISDVVRSATADGTVLIGPAAAGAAPRRDGHDPVADRVRASTLRLTSVAGLAGTPVLVVPGASLPPGPDDAVDSLPLGIALMGAPGADLDLFDLISPP